MRIVGLLQKAFTLVITIALSGLWPGVWFFGLQSLKSDSCDIIDTYGEKCVGLSNEIVGSCAGGLCPNDANNSQSCFYRRVDEINYIGCSHCLSGASNDICREYRDPAACQQSLCKYKMRQRYCYCNPTTCTLSLEPGNYSSEIDIHKKECIL